MPMSVITVAGINPVLNILGAKQQLNYTQELSGLQITNAFIPNISVASQFDAEYRNNMYSGFRWSHITTDTDTHGSLTLQSFINAESSGVDLISFTEDDEINIIAPLVMTEALDLNSNKIINLATPTLDTDAATKAYVDMQTGVQAAFYMDNNATSTNLPTIDTFVKMAGVTTSAFLNNFTMPLDNRLLYTGTNTITALVSVSASLLSSTDTIELGLAVYKNGSLVLSPGYTRTAGNNTLGIHTVAIPVQFATNDYIEVYLSSVYDITTATAAYINVTITL